MEDNVSIVLVDDHMIVRSGLKALIEVLGNYKIVNEYVNGKALIDAIQASAPLPDILVMDLEMPVMDGETAMRWLQEHAPSLKVLILTWDAGEKKIIDLFRLGVRGYLLKSCDPETLRKAITDVHTTGYYHSELLQTAMMKNMEIGIEKKHIEDRVSEREMTFLKLVCDKNEYTYDNMAELMQVHRRTIDGYREALFDKFNIKSKTGLVMFAIKHGFIEL